jgi:hypothetical protein
MTIHLKHARWLGILFAILALALLTMGCQAPSPAPSQSTGTPAPLKAVSSNPPAIEFSLDNVTWGAASAPISVPASARLYFRLSATQGVSQTTWEVTSTDETTSPSNYSIIITDNVRQAHGYVAAVGGVGTAAILRATVNAGQYNGGVNLGQTQGSAKWYTPPLVLALDETNQSGQYGWLPALNKVLRSSGGGSVSLSLTGSSAVTGSTASAFWVGAVQPSVDFPGTTTATLKATLYCDHTGGESAWVADAGYSPNDIVGNDNGAGTGIPVVYVATMDAGCTSAGTHGPTGFGTGLLDQGSDACLWRSQEARVFVVNFSTSTIIGTSTVSITAGSALADGGASLLETSIDLTSALMGLTSPNLIAVDLAADPADTGPDGGPKVTVAHIGNARIVFQ